MTKTKFVIFILMALACFNQYCFSTSSQTTEPWLTGPILTPSARVVPGGHYNFEPYVYYTEISGRYDNHGHVVSIPKIRQEAIQFVYKIGLTERIDLEGLFQGARNSSQGYSSTVFGDIPVGLDIQLLKEGKNTPYLKLTIQETFPAGKHDQLDPEKLRTDSGGTGAFITTIGIGASKTFFFSKHHYLRCRSFLAASFAPAVKVKGFNAYGGSALTKGKVYPGNVYNFLFGAEYTLSINWALAFDFFAAYSKRDHFRGFTEAQVGSPYSVDMSIAPAIEYNWSDSIGLIVGPWFSIAGRNSSRFISAVAAFNYYH